MNSPFSFACSALVCALGAVAQAQSGQLDQQSPYQPQPGANTNFPARGLGNRWQIEVRAGLVGRLRGFVLQVTGTQGTTVGTKIRLGPGWNFGPEAFQATIVKPTQAPWDNVYVDTTSAGIFLVPGSLFVIEIGGLDANGGVNGSWVAAPAPPLYPQSLFKNGVCYSDCQYRIGFVTYVEHSVGVGYCFGDFSGAPCPCGNAGIWGTGCANSVFSTGAHLFGAGTASISADSFVLNGIWMPDSSVLYFQGTLRTAGGAGAIFGDGLRCAGGIIHRLGTKLNAAGASSYPGAGDVQISIVGANSAGNVRRYQGWYHNSASYCTASTFNLTNGFETIWIP